MSFRNVFFNVRAAFAVAVMAGLGACINAPDPPDDATVRFESGAALSACVGSSIALSIDGAQVGTMAAGQSQSHTVTPGAHALGATAREGTWGPRSISVRAGETYAWTLTC